ANVTVDVTSAQDANGKLQTNASALPECRDVRRVVFGASVAASDALITDSDTGVGKTFTVAVVFDQAMNTAVNPTLTFSPAVTSKIGRASCRESAYVLAFTAGYTVDDVNGNVRKGTLEVS